MAEYQYLTDDDRAQIVAEVIVAHRTPESILREYEAAHFRSMIEAKLGEHSVPDPYEPPDTRKAEADQSALEAEAVKLPPVKVDLAAAAIAEVG